MSRDYDAAEAAWREAWRLAREAEAATAETAEREAADAAFGLALCQAIAALGHPLATQRAQLTDAYVAVVGRVAAAQSETLALAEASPERDQANAHAIAAYVEFGQSMGIERMIEERVAYDVGEIVPEDPAEWATYFQMAAARVLYDLGGLARRILLTLAGVVSTLPEGRLPALLQPKHFGRGEVGTTTLLGSLQRDIALRILMESRLANQQVPAWVKDNRIGITELTYQRWLAKAGSAEQASVAALTDKLLRQEPLTEVERELHDRLTRFTLSQMMKGRSALT